MKLNWLRKLLFLLPPETAHDLTIGLLKYVPKWFVIKKRVSVVKPRDNGFEFKGLTFLNRVGLAAGFDKNAVCVDALFMFGFGFIEIGAVTPKPQPGNPKPRLWRLTSQHALINHFGFNSVGVEQFVKNLKHHKKLGIVGVNLGKNKQTLLEHAYLDYLICLEKTFPYVDYATINISSPNTPDLRALQSERYIQKLVSEVVKKRDELAAQFKREFPLFVKLDADIEMELLEKVIPLLITEKIDGVIMSNSLKSREGVAHLPEAANPGGLSGRPIFQKALPVVKRIKALAGDRLVIIGCGGISSKNDIQQMLEAGADLVQVYTGWVYGRALNM